MTNKEVMESVSACMCAPSYCEGCKYNNLALCRDVLFDDLRESMKTDEIELSVSDDAERIRREVRFMDRYPCITSYAFGLLSGLAVAAVTVMMVVLL